MLVLKYKLSVLGFYKESTCEGSDLPDLVANFVKDVQAISSIVPVKK